MKFLRWSLLFIFVVTISYLIWSSINRIDKDFRMTLQPLTKDALISVGKNSNMGNIIGIQPLLTAENYSSETNFSLTIRPYFELAKEKGLFNEKTIVVFPEYIGSWLVAAGEKKSVYAEPVMMDAMITMVSSNLFKFGRTYLTAPEVPNKINYAAFAMKAGEMAKIYQTVFSKLAKEFIVTIVAGSIVLPEPEIDKNGNLIVANGMLYNTSVVFDSNGNIISPLVKKIFPVDEEASFTVGGAVEQNPVFETPAGKLGVLVCADSWYPDAYSSFKGDVKIIAVPSLGATDDVWNAPWNGYNGFDAPSDVDTSDYKKLTEGQAWEKYTMGTRAVKAGIHYGMNVFFAGQLWDKKAEGRVLVLNNDLLIVYPPAYNGRLINLWLN